jgi:hypothetical protein
MCTVLLPPGVNPIAVNKYIISYHIIARAVRKHISVGSWSKGSRQGGDCSMLNVVEIRMMGMWRYGRD